MHQYKVALEESFVGNAKTKTHWFDDPCLAAAPVFVLPALFEYFQFLR
jgi:hypothetical protein